MNEPDSPMLRAHRRGWLAVILALIGFVSVYIALWPRMITVTDEAQYLQLATMYAAGQKTVAKIDPFTQTETREIPSRYVPGVPLLMAVPIRVFGWRGAYVIPLGAAVIATLALAKWLSDNRLSPAWAVLFLGYLPAIALARVGMSDIPSAAAATIVFTLLWRPSGWGWLIAGMIAGLSVLLRETNAIVFAPFAIGSLSIKSVRRPFFFIGLMAGGLMSIGLLLLLRGSQSPRAGEVGGFSLQYLLPHLPHYLFALLVMLPGGLIAVALYRGAWRWELIGSVVFVVSMFSTWWYVGAESGLARGLVLGAGRFCLPIVPLVVFAIATGAERLLAVRQGQQIAILRLAPFIVAVLVVAESLAVQWVLGRWAAGQADIVAAIRHPLPKDAVVISDFFATNKALSPIFDSQFAPVVAVEYQNVDAGKIDSLLARGIQPWVVMLYRQDSPAIKPQSDAARAWLANIDQAFNMQMATDQKVTNTDELQIAHILARK